GSSPAAPTTPGWLSESGKTLADAADRAPSGAFALAAVSGFRRVWLAGGLANTMRWLEILVIGVYTFEVTSSPFMVAVMTFFRAAPMVLLGAFIGALAERFDRRMLLLAGLSMLSATSAVLAALAYAGALTLSHLAI